MVYASSGEIPHHSASHQNAGDTDAGCLELALASASSIEDIAPAMCTSIDFKVPSWSSGTSMSLLAFLDSRLSSNPPLLFLLLSTLRN